MVEPPGEEGIFNENVIQGRERVHPRVDLQVKLGGGVGWIVQIGRQGQSLVELGEVVVGRIKGTTAGTTAGGHTPLLGAHTPRVGENQSKKIKVNYL